MNHRLLLALSVITAASLACSDSTKAPEAPAAKPTATAPASDVLASGTLKLPAGSKASGAAVFVSLRDPAGGPPLAAVRLPAGPFPMKFEITTANVISMGAPRPVPAEFNLKAKLDADGNAMSTTADDLQAIQLAKKGAVVELTLSPASP